jgi:hypothetical protein
VAEVGSSGYFHHRLSHLCHLIRPENATSDGTKQACNLTSFQELL